MEKQDIVAIMMTKEYAEVIIINHNIVQDTKHTKMEVIVVVTAKIVIHVQDIHMDMKVVQQNGPHTVHQNVINQQQL